MTPTIAPPISLVPLLGHPDDDPYGWRQAQRPGAVAIVGMSLPSASGVPGQRTVVPAPVRTPRWIALAEGVERLLAAGALPLGHLTLSYATRPVTDLLAEITRWTALPVRGLFLDHAPAGPYQIGPVIQAVRAARRGGLATVVVNPGCTADPLYRRLGVTICTFEGTWADYRTWAGEGSAPGDGHLVYGVPASAVAAARSRAAALRAGLLLLSPTVPFGQSTVLSWPTNGAAWAGSAGRRTTIGS